MRTDKIIQEGSKYVKERIPENVKFTRKFVRIWQKVRLKCCKPCQRLWLEKNMKKEQVSFDEFCAVCKPMVKEKWEKTKHMITVKQ